MAEAWRDAWYRVGGMRVPALAETPRQHWREVLITCSEPVRNHAVWDHYLTPEQRADARALVAELPPPPSQAILEAMRAPPPVGFATRIERPPISRQLNLRLATADYEALAVGAR